MAELIESITQSTMNFECWNWNGSREKSEIDLEKCLSLTWEVKSNSMPMHLNIFYKKNQNPQCISGSFTVVAKMNDSMNPPWMANDMAVNSALNRFTPHIIWMDDMPYVLNRSLCQFDVKLSNTKYMMSNKMPVNDVIDDAVCWSDLLPSKNASIPREISPAVKYS